LPQGGTTARQWLGVPINEMKKRSTLYKRTEVDAKVGCTGGMEAEKRKEKKRKAREYRGGGTCDLEKPLFIPTFVSRGPQVREKNVKEKKTQPTGMAGDSWRSERLEKRNLSAEVQSEGSKSHGGGRKRVLLHELPSCSRGENTL